jgi:hypothetical protein
MNRFEKIEWLKETCSKDFIENDLLTNIVMWMSEEEFNMFYDSLCRNFDIARDKIEFTIKYNRE